MMYTVLLYMLMVYNAGIGFDSCHMICLTAVVNILLTSELSKLFREFLLLKLTRSVW